MPIWGWVLIGIGVLLLLGAAVALALVAWKAYERRVLLRLVVRSEAVEAVSAALTDALTRLAQASDEELQVFADDPTSVERRVLQDVASRANLLAVELDNMPLPARLVPVAEAIADAAVTVCEEAGKVGEEPRGGESLDRLSSTDLARVRAYIGKARFSLSEACRVCGLDETAVYGGGLYL